ncbi:MAG TPA: hypothetical protein VNK95_08910 [Caldilineaceae bacterium]|nr:hypothetical protein [Caldilineaceae bacterium]
MQPIHRMNTKTKTRTRGKTEWARRRWLALALAALVVLALATPVWAGDDDNDGKKGRGRGQDKEKQEQRAQQQEWKAAPLFWFVVSMLEQRQGSWRLISDQSADQSLVVDNDQSSWRFVDESKPGAPTPNGAQVQVGAQAPAGETAAQFVIGSSMEALTLQNLDPSLRGLRLDALERLSYCTFLVDAPLPYAVMLQINIDANLDDEERGWQGRLVFEPFRNGAVIQGEWQCWDTLAGAWYATGGPVAAFANLQSPQPLDAILARFPDLGFHPDFGGIVLRAGDGWATFDGYVDGVLLSTAQETWLYDFEGPGAAKGEQTISDPGAGGGNDNNIRRISLSDKDACKDGGWRAWGFRNQGQCVSYVNYLNNHPAPAEARSREDG